MSGMAETNVSRVRSSGHACAVTTSERSPSVLRLAAVIMLLFAAAHAAGRRLFVETTNLDTMRMTVWDMGAIAGAPGGAALFRAILLASASVPGAYPPVPLIADGKPGLFVDGGVTRQIYIPDMPPGGAAGAMVLVFNNTLSSDAPLGRLTAFGAAQRGFSTLLRSQRRDLVEHAKLRARQSGADVSVYTIPADTPAARLQDFDAKAMARTFAVGLRMGRDRPM